MNLFEVWRVILFGLLSSVSSLDQLTDKMVAVDDPAVRTGLLLQGMALYGLDIDTWEGKKALGASPNDEAFLAALDLSKVESILLPSGRVIELKASRLKIKHYLKFSELRPALLAFGRDVTALNWILHARACGYELRVLLPYVDDEWYDKMKALSNIVALTLNNDQGLGCLLELHTLKGFTKDEKFDLKRAAEEFAHSGNNLTAIGLKNWEDRFLMTDFDPVYVPFKEFIRSGVWQTAGSADKKFDFKVLEDKEEVKIRALKNMIIDQSTVDELAALSGVRARFEDKAIVKEEITKSRLAVASDTRWYFVSAWLSHMFHSAMRKLKGVVSEESVEDESARRKEMQSEFSNSWVVSFDYSKFDHQVPTSIILLFVRRMINQLQNYLTAEEDEALGNLLYALDHRVLIAGDITIPASGGLPSGWALTTMVANWFSYCVLKSIPVVKRFWLKGDDAVLVVNSTKEAGVVFGMMKLFGVNFSVTKSFVRYGSGQFLRVFTSAHDKIRDSAIVARACAAAHQAKPWRVADFLTDKPLYLSAGAVGTAFARAGRLDAVFGFAAKLKLPDGCYVPVSYGGLGWLPSTSIIRIRAEEEREPVIGVPPTFNFSWRSRLIASQVRVAPDIYTYELAKRQFVGLVKPPERAKYATVVQKWVADDLVYSAYQRPSTVNPLDVQYLMLKENITKTKALRILAPDYYSARYRLRRWGYTAAERYLDSGFELSALIPQSNALSGLRKMVGTIYPEPGENYFRSVFGASKKLLDAWLSEPGSRTQAA